MKTINSRELREGHLFKLSENDFGYALLDSDTEGFLPESLQTGRPFCWIKHTDVALIGEWITESDGYSHFVEA